MPPGTPVEFMRRLANGRLQRVGNQVQLTNPDTDEPLPVDPVTGGLETISAAELASINGHVVCRWISNISPGAAQIVLQNGPVGDDPGIYYDIQPGEFIMITQVCVELLTLNDNVVFQLGYTDAVGGGGNFTPVMPPRILQTGGVFAPFDGVTFDFRPAGRIRYADGARSITFRVDCNDAGATITPAWHGYRITT